MKTNFSRAKKYYITGRDITLEEIHDISHAKPGEVIVEISPEALKATQIARDFVHKVVDEGKPVYGINTGFGALSDKFINKDDLAELQVNLVRSHCTGVGRPFHMVITRAIMLLRANCLAQGHSGVNPEIIQLLLDFINYGITPIVPEKGSVGASGDLAPLSHIALNLIGEGQVIFEGKEIGANLAINSIGKKPAVLGPKDGLALINGTAVMAALGSLALHRANSLIKIADISSCLTLEAVRGSRQAYHQGITALKPHPGQIECCDNLNRLLVNSEVSESHKDCNKVQDPYSLRCVPQVHGACRQTLKHALDVFQVEINSVTDNPLIFPETGEIISGGNFHGEAVAMCMDYLAIGLAELCNICERRVEKMMNPIFSELPPFLIEDSGLNSGLMIAQVTLAALASENKYLCHPASVDSIPTSTDKEDHVSMGVTSGRKLIEVLDNLKYGLSIEILCNTQALEFLKPLKPASPLVPVYDLVRMHVTPIVKDRVLSKDIESIKKLIESNEILKVVEQEIGPLR
ncbi:MAG: histidine ammonia-lyase [Bacteriovoracaceae bacterium]|jgi:histidine ammonia-lyase|nr:histidine ammonia-lyase [Bacteriovoracaceae bacterium]